MQHIFNNKAFIEPSADAVVNLSASPSVAAMGSSTVLILGESTRGSSDKPYEFTTVADAKRTLGAGSGVDLCQICFAPSGQTAGASKVIFAKTNKSYPVVAKLPAFSSDNYYAAYKIEVANSSSETISDYSGKIGFKLSVNGSEPVEYSAQAQYLPNASSSKCGVAKALDEIKSQLVKVMGLAITKDTEIVTASNYAMLKIPLKCISNQVVLSDPIKPGYKSQASAGFLSNTQSTIASTVTVGGEESVLSKVTIESLESGDDLEYAVKISLGVATFYSGWDASSFNVLGLVEGAGTAEGLEKGLADHATLSKLFKVNLNGAAGTQSISTSQDCVPFYVRKNESTNEASFSAALTLTADMDKSFCITDQTGENYHTLLSQYATGESMYPCDAVLGRELGVNPFDIMSYAAGFNSENTILAYPGIKMNLGGETKLYPATYFAAAVAGVAAGLPCQEPLTRKSITALGFEDIDYGGNSTKIVREQLLNKGVLFGWYTDSNGYNILKGINTVQNQNIRGLLGTDNRTHEISIARIRKQMAKELKVSADAVFPGTTKLHPNSTDVANFVANYLNSKVGTYLASWDDKSLSVSLVEDAWYVEAGCQVNSPVNFAFFTLNLSL